jgi:hypothetical protein
LQVVAVAVKITSAFAAAKQMEMLFYGMNHDHSEKVVRVHLNKTNGIDINLPHYPPIKKEL